MVEVGDAVDADLAAICALLERAGLPTSDIPTSKPLFKLLYENGRIVAVGGLQYFDSAALVRSVVVADDRRGTGLGRIVVGELEKGARHAGIGRLVLLTQTARDFFLSLGYQLTQRSDAPQEVLGSEEFRTLCPASATCMMKVLTTS